MTFTGIFFHKNKAFSSYHSKRKIKNFVFFTHPFDQKLLSRNIDVSPIVLPLFVILAKFEWLFTWNFFHKNEAFSSYRSKRQIKNFVFFTRCGDPYPWVWGSLPPGLGNFQKIVPTLGTIWPRSPYPQGFTVYVPLPPGTNFRKTSRGGMWGQELNRA